jgi:hypothetical protein
VNDPSNPRLHLGTPSRQARLCRGADPRIFPWDAAALEETLSTPGLAQTSPRLETSGAEPAPCVSRALRWAPVLRWRGLHARWATSSEGMVGRRAGEAGQRSGLGGKPRVGTTITAHRVRHGALRYMAEGADCGRAAEPRPGMTAWCEQTFLLENRRRDDAQSGAALSQHLRRELLGSAPPTCNGLSHYLGLLHSALQARGKHIAAEHATTCTRPVQAHRYSADNRATAQPTPSSSNPGAASACGSPAAGTTVPSRVAPALCRAVWPPGPGAARVLSAPSISAEVGPPAITESDLTKEINAPTSAGQDPVRARSARRRDKTSVSREAMNARSDPEAACPIGFDKGAQTIP